jgi:surface antigen
MIAQPFIGIRNYIAIILFMMLALAVLGCTAAQRSADIHLNPEPLPVYRQGTTFVYADGTWETVNAVAPNIVTWKDHRGYTSNGTPDFTRRRIYYQTRTRQGTRTFRAREDLVFKGKEDLWPLIIGNRASYTETGTWIDKRDGSEHSYRSHWSCEVAGIERVTVPAGEFSTWKITCTRYNVPRQGVQSRAKEIKTWYFAPEIGHYVLVTRNYLYDKPSRRQELLAVLPPKKILPTRARRKMERSFQKAMEHKVSGNSASWSMSSAAASGITTPYGTFKLEDGTFCRRYVQDLNFSDDQQTYYGMACRNPKGKWVVPRR